MRTVLFLCTILVCVGLQRVAHGALSSAREELLSERLDVHNFENKTPPKYSYGGANVQTAQLEPWKLREGHERLVHLHRGHMQRHVLAHYHPPHYKPFEITMQPSEGSGREGAAVTWEDHPDGGKVMHIDMNDMQGHLQSTLASHLSFIQETDDTEGDSGDEDGGGFDTKEWPGLNPSKAGASEGYGATGRKLTRDYLSELHKKGMYEMSEDEWERSDTLGYTGGIRFRESLVEDIKSGPESDGIDVTEPGVTLVTPNGILRIRTCHHDKGERFYDCQADLLGVLDVLEDAHTHNVVNGIPLHHTELANGQIIDLAVPSWAPQDPTFDATLHVGDYINGNGASEDWTRNFRTEEELDEMQEEFLADHGINKHGHRVSESWARDREAAQRERQRELQWDKHPEEWMDWDPSEDPAPVRPRLVRRKAGRLDNTNGMVRMFMKKGLLGSVGKMVGKLSGDIGVKQSIPIFMAAHEFRNVEIMDAEVGGPEKKKDLLGQIGDAAGDVGDIAGAVAKAASDEPKAKATELDEIIRSSEHAVGGDSTNGVEGGSSRSFLRASRIASSRGRRVVGRNMGTGRYGVHKNKAAPNRHGRAIGVRTSGDPHSRAKARRPQRVDRTWERMVAGVKRDIERMVPRVNVNGRTGAVSLLQLEEDPTGADGKDGVAEGEGKAGGGPEQAKKGGGEGKEEAEPEPEPEATSEEYDEFASEEEENIYEFAEEEEEAALEAEAAEGEAGEKVTGGVFDPVPIKVESTDSLFSFDPKLNFKCNIKSFKPKSLSITFGGIFHIRLMVKMEVLGAIDYSYHMPIPVVVINAGSFTIPLGPVPLVMLFKIPIDFGFNVKSHGRSVVETGMNLKAGLEVGGGMNNGKWKGIWKPTFTKEFYGPYIKNCRDNNLQPFIKVGVQALIMGAVGPKFEIEPYVDFDIKKYGERGEWDKCGAEEEGEEEEEGEDEQGKEGAAAEGDSDTTPADDDKGAAEAPEANGIFRAFRRKKSLGSRRNGDEVVRYGVLPNGVSQRIHRYGSKPLPVGPGFQAVPEDLHDRWRFFDQFREMEFSELQKKGKGRDEEDEFKDQDPPGADGTETGAGAGVGAGQPIGGDAQGAKPGGGSGSALASGSDSGSGSGSGDGDGFKPDGPPTDSWWGLKMGLRGFLGIDLVIPLGVTQIKLASFRFPLVDLSIRLSSGCFPWKSSCVKLVLVGVKKLLIAEGEVEAPPEEGEAGWTEVGSEGGEGSGDGGGSGDDGQAAGGEKKKVDEAKE